MRLTIRAASSLALGFAGIIVLGAGLNHLVDVGSCTSGGPSAIAPPCPEGTALWSLLPLIGFVLWMAGLFLSEGGLVKPGAGLVVWTAGFAGGGVALLIKALTSPMQAEAKLGLYVVAAVFIPLGLAFGLAGVAQLVVARRGHPRPGPRRKAAVLVNVDDVQLQQLQRLRTMGALTRAEFDRLKGDAVTTGERLAMLRRLADLKVAGILTTEEFEAKKQAVL